VMAIDAGLLAGHDEYMKRSTELVEHIKSAKPLDGQKVVLPGEQGDALARQAEISGEIDIADAIWKELGDFVARQS
jgi:LDH2 family malate/lactate/ureidoglycolate dehydrogenase